MTNESLDLASKFFTERLSLACLESSRSHMEGAGPRRK